MTSTRLTGCACAVAGAAAFFGLGCSHGDSAAVAADAREIGVVANAPDITGRDGGSSALAWGRSVWLYGDTVLTVNDVSGTNWHSNSASSTDDLDASDGIGGLSETRDALGAVEYFVPETDDEAAFNALHRGENCVEPPCSERWAIWPGAMVFDAPRDRTILFYGLVFVGSESLAGGQSIAIWDDPSQKARRPAFRPDTAHPTLLFPEGELPFGAASLVDGDDLVAFACPKDGLSYPCKLGRVPLASVEDPSAWSYYAGDGRYSSDPSDAETLFEGWVSMSIFYDAHLSRWLAVYSSVFSNDVVTRTAESLTGPWSDEGVLFVADRKGADDWTYDAQVHTEYSEQSGKVVYVTYTRPNGNGWFGSETALWRVELE